MKAPIAQAAAEAASASSCDFNFFWGLKIAKFKRGRVVKNKREASTRVRRKGRNGANSKGKG
jgi:hypothetical protein